jgi:hypothetical protein
MANVSVKLQLNEHGADSVSGIAFDLTGNNVSKAIVWNNTVANSGSNGICIEKYAIGEAGVLLDETLKYNGYMFVSTDGSGNGTLVCTISGSQVDSMTFYGDTEADQYPTTAILDEGTAHELTIYSDDNKWSIIFDIPDSSHTVKFTTWHRINYNMCFTHIEIFPHILEFDNYWIKQISSTAESNSNPKDVHFGILANTGSIKMIDRDGELKDYALAGYLNKETFILTVYVNGSEVQHHIASESPYYDNSSTLGIELTNDLAGFDNIAYGGHTITTGDTMTAYALLVDAITSTSDYTASDVAIMCNILINVDGTEMTVEALLTSIIIPATSADTVIEASSLRDFINKICVLGQLAFIMNDTGYFKFVNARPKATAAELTNAIAIPLKTQKSTFEYEILLTNAYSDVIFS